MQPKVKTIMLDPCACNLEDARVIHKPPPLPQDLFNAQTNMIYLPISKTVFLFILQNSIMISFDVLSQAIAGPETW